MTLPKKLDNNLVGCLAEYIFATRAMAKGFKISMPLLDSSTYDCILDNGAALLKIQIKSLSMHRKKRPNRNGYKVNLRNGLNYYTRHEVDFFAIYLSKDDGFFIIPNYEQMSFVLNRVGKYQDNFNNFGLFY